MNTGVPSGTLSTSAETSVVCGADAAVRGGDAERAAGAVDRDPVAAEPPGRQVRLGRAERQCAAPVRGRVEIAAEGVGDRESARRGFDARRADGHRESAHDAVAALEHRAPRRQVDDDRQPRPAAVEPPRIELHPREAVVRQLRGRHCCPATDLPDDAEHGGRAELGPAVDLSHLFTASGLGAQLGLGSRPHPDDRVGPRRRLKPWPRLRLRRLRGRRRLDLALGHLAFAGSGGLPGGLSRAFRSAPAPAHRPRRSPGR